MRYCARCILPDTRPNLVLDQEGVCNACRSHESRAGVDWAERRGDFERVVADAKRRARGYDSLVPVSGGKDSMWQVVTLLEAGLHPLAVTWKPASRTEIGQENLEALIALGVDHIDYQVNPNVESRFLRLAFERFGAPAIPMHLALFNIPLTIAVRFGIPLVVYGENSAVEYGGDREFQGFRLDADWIARFGVTHGTTAADWIGPELSEHALRPYFGPDTPTLERENVLAIFLGHFFSWDPETSLATARRHGFRSRPEGPKTGYYDYADIDDAFISIHHWLKWYKFGFTRTFDNLSLEIRNGRMSREQAIEILRERGEERPDEDIAVFCDFVGLSRDEFFAVAERFRNRKIWSRNRYWLIDGFLVPDWEWA